MEANKAKNIVIITSGYFPEGDAGAVRLFYNAKALTESGYSVRVLCRGKANDRGCIEGIDYQSLRTKNGNRILKFIDYKSFPSKVKEQLKTAGEISYVYIYNAPMSVFQFCKGFCKDRNIPLIHDCVEWYSPDEFKLGKLDKAYRSKNKLNTKVIDKSFSVIAISSFLENHFKGKGIHTLRLPILCDGQKCAPQKNNGERLTLFYAGLPFRKDYIGNLLRGALLLSEEEQKRLRIVLVGATREYLIRSSDIPEQVLDRCTPFLQLKGRVPRTEVLALMEEADFTVLPRDASRRYAQAGFPSKVVESLSNATPILCNYSSDLELYLHDGNNALIAENHTPEALAETIRKALLLTPEEKSQMSKNARESAKEYFDYRNYSGALDAFFQSAK